LSRILVVDDNVLALEGTAAVLRATDHDVVIARDAEAALRALLAGEFDVLLTDLELPGLSGWELAKQARLLLPRLKVFVMTGWIIDPEDVRATGGIVERIFLKPVDAEDLLGAL
jgi:CheY-like chemotaxis protein